jgi:hypothetical protein
LKSVKLSIDTQSELKDYVKIDIAKGDYSEGLLGLLEGQALYKQGKTLAITPEHYKDGNTLFCFDMTPGMLAGSHEGFLPPQRGNLRLHVEFSTQTTYNIICYFLMYFENEILITGDRQVIFEYNT